MIWRRKQLGTIVWPDGRPVYYYEASLFNIRALVVEASGGFLFTIIDDHKQKLDEDFWRVEHKNYDQVMQKANKRFFEVITKSN